MRNEAFEKQFFDLQVTILKNVSSVFNNYLFHLYVVAPEADLPLKRPAILMSIKVF